MAFMESSLQEIHDRRDDMQGDSDKKFDEVTSRIDAVQSDVPAILTLLNKKFPPGS